MFSSHLFWTSSSLDVPVGVAQEEGYTGFLIHLPSAVRALIFLARRIQPFLPLVDREVEFCVCMVITYGKGMDQPGKVANPARSQLNRENEYSPVPVRA